MTDAPAGSRRDTTALAEKYSETAKWQYQRGLLTIDLANPAPSETVLDLGCGTGELTRELARRVGPSGRVIGVDPAEARLELARRSASADLDNLHFSRATGEDLSQIDDASIDLVYSNYALHWVLRPERLFAEIHRVLRPGGRFVAEFLGEVVSLFEELVFLMPDGETVMQENIFLDDASWRGIVTAQDLEITRIDWPRLSLEFHSLDSLYDWLNATSHGAFDAARIAPNPRAALAARFPGAVSVPCQALRMQLRRPG